MNMNRSAQNVACVLLAAVLAGCQGETGGQQVVTEQSLASSEANPPVAVLPPQPAKTTEAPILSPSTTEEAVAPPASPLTADLPAVTEIVPEQRADPPVSDVLAVAAGEQDWPRFRGPDGSGISLETELPLEWDATKNIVWKTPLPGPGASSPITFGEHVYVTCYSGYGIHADNPGNPQDLRRHLVCLHHSDGRILWDKSLPAQAAEQPYSEMLLKHGYASSTPSADAEGVYVFYGAGGVAAYTHTGEQKWHRSCGVNTHHYGSASSPILVDKLLIVDASVESPGYPGGSSLYALDKQTGEEVWHQTQIGGGAYLTPTFVESGGMRQLVVSQPWGNALAGASPDTGEVLWRCNVSAYTPTPVVDQTGVLYVLSKTGYAAIRTGGSGNVTETHKLWEVNSPIYRQSSPIYWEGHLYWIPMDGGIACCASAATGELLYRERISTRTGPVYASPVLADGRIYFVTREEGTFVLPARPHFEILAHNRIETDDSIFNGSPAISNKKIFLRSDRYLYCIGAVAP